LLRAVRFPLGGADSGGVGGRRVQGMLAEMGSGRQIRVRRRGMTGWWKSSWHQTLVLGGGAGRVLAGHSVRVACVMPHLICGIASQYRARIEWPLKTCMQRRKAATFLLQRGRVHSRSPTFGRLALLLTCPQLPASVSYYHCHRRPHHTSLYSISIPLCSCTLRQLHMFPRRPDALIDC